MRRACARPCTDFVQTLYGLCADLVQSLCRPCTDLAQTLYRPCCSCSSVSSTSRIASTMRLTPSLPTLSLVADSTVSSRASFLKACSCRTTSAMLCKASGRKTRGRRKGEVVVQVIPAQVRFSKLRDEKANTGRAWVQTALCFIACPRRASDFALYVAIGVGYVLISCLNWNSFSHWNLISFLSIVEIMVSVALGLLI